MKKIAENKEQNWFLVEEWETKSGQKAMVLKCEWRLMKEMEKLLGHPPHLHDFFTGYVQLPEGKKLSKKQQDKINVHGGVTFYGEKTDFPGTWVGFDMAHYGDENMQSLEYAKKECENLAWQLP